MATQDFAHAALVVNTRSRGGERAYEHAHEALVGSGVPVRSAYSISDPGRIPETVHEVLAEGCDLLILGAGDGTVSAVVDMLAHHEAVFGLLPLGTANDFARTMEIPA
ncbi:MAG: diacylglycerol kinase family protein, partial [Streptosporangiales bacterium]